MSLNPTSWFRFALDLACVPAISAVFGEYPIQRTERRNGRRRGRPGATSPPFIERGQKNPLGSLDRLLVIGAKRRALYRAARLLRPRWHMKEVAPAAVL